MKHILNVLFVCQISKEIGIGHLSRVSVAANALKEHADANVYLLIQGEIINNFILEKLPHKFIGENISLFDSIGKSTKEIDASIVVFDLKSNYITKELINFLKKLSAMKIKIIAIDCLWSSTCKIDLVYIPSFWFDPVKKIKCRHHYFYGWDCFLLSNHKKISVWNPGKKVLVLTGGSDTTKLNKTLPTLLEQFLPKRTIIYWIQGPYADAPDIPQNPSLIWKKYHSPDNLENLMLEVNYAICIYGISFFELICKGVPTVVFSPYANAYAKELIMLSKENICIVSNDAINAVNDLNNLMNDNDKSFIISNSAKLKITKNNEYIFAARVKEIV